MQDQPTARELIESVAQFLTTELNPALNDPRLKFRALVAANVLHIVSREMDLKAAQVQAEYERLITLSANSLPVGQGEEVREEVERMTRELARTIRTGAADEGAFHDAVLTHVEQTVIEKLQVANPKYLERFTHGSF